MKLALGFDADYFVFAAASASVQSFMHDDGIITQWADHNQAREAFMESIENIQKRNRRYSSAKAIMVFTDKVNWRNGVLESYKGNRKGLRGGKPLGYMELKAWVEANYTCISRPTLEGDDVLGILMTNPSLVGADEFVGVSPDKDFNTIPGRFLWLTGGAEKVITEAEADRWHMMQTLAGDATDGYTGCPGIGKDTALEFLDNPYIAFLDSKVLKSGPRKGETVEFWNKRELEPGERTWDAIVSLYNKAGLTEEDALVQARVARILRSSDYQNRAVILWNPPEKEEVDDVLLQSAERVDAEGTGSADDQGDDRA